MAKFEIRRLWTRWLPRASFPVTRSGVPGSGSASLATDWESVEYSLPAP